MWSVSVEEVGSVENEYELGMWICGGTNWTSPMLGLTCEAVACKDESKAAGRTSGSPNSG